jgi:tRNA(fMet)-specific endonuclease VapC
LLSNRLDQRLKEVQALLRRLSLIAFTPEDAMVAAEVRRSLERKGRKIGALDVLIGCQALARRWTLVTGDIKHFGRIEGLDVLDWTVIDPPP